MPGNRCGHDPRCPALTPARPSQVEQEKRMEETRRWNMTCAKYLIADLAPEECRRRINAELGLPADYSPGKYA